MGERILREEGFDVSSVADEAAALARLADGDPDLVIADAFLPGSGGLDLCRYIKKFHRHVRVILTAGQLEVLDEKAARAAGCDAVLRKPFEASMVIGTIRALVQEATSSPGDCLPRRWRRLDLCRFWDAPVGPTVAAAPDPERIQAAITLALDVVFPNLVREITEKVLVALGH